MMLWKKVFLYLGVFIFVCLLLLLLDVFGLVVDRIRLLCSDSVSVVVKKNDIVIMCVGL